MASVRPTDDRLVLVVDDEPDARAVLRSLLTDLKYSVVEASDGRGALNYLTSDEPEPALIVVDLMMPDMTGWEFVTVLQAYLRLATIPVLVVSGVELRDGVLREEGVAEFFKKPLDTERFVEAVRRHALPASHREARWRGAKAALVRSRV